MTDKSYRSHSTRTRFEHVSDADYSKNFVRDSDIKHVSSAKSRAKSQGTSKTGARQTQKRVKAAAAAKTTATTAALDIATSGEDSNSTDNSSTDHVVGKTRSISQRAAHLYRKHKAQTLSQAEAIADEEYLTGQKTVLSSSESSASALKADVLLPERARENAVATHIAKQQASLSTTTTDTTCLAKLSAEKSAASSAMSPATPPASSQNGAVSRMLRRQTAVMEKGSAISEDTRMQASINFYKSRNSLVAASEKAGSFASTHTTSTPATLASAGVKTGGMSAFGIVAGVVIVVFLLIVLCVLGALMLVGGVKEEVDIGSLTGNEAAIAGYLLDKELDALHVAAIMGNISQESGFDPSAVESNGEGIGICQWSFGRKTAYLAYAAGQGRQWSDITCQLDWLWIEYTGGRFSSGQRATFEEMDDLDQATMYFGRIFEAPSEQYANWDKRKTEAKRCYSAMVNGGSGGTGQDYENASASQKSIVNSAITTPFQGNGWCAAYVTQVFSRAGASVPYGNACDMARAWWCSSSNKGDLKVGMVIATEHSPWSFEFGHVGVYIGDNKVMHNSSFGIETTNLDKWIQDYKYLCQARWGWANGVDLS